MVTHVDSRSKPTPTRPIALTGLPTRIPRQLDHIWTRDAARDTFRPSSVLRNGSPQRFCQFHRDLIDSLVERDPRCPIQLPNKPTFLLRRLQFDVGTPAVARTIHEIRRVKSSEQVGCEREGPDAVAWDSADTHDGNAGLWLCTDASAPQYTSDILPYSKRLSEK